MINQYYKEDTFDDGIYVSEMDAVFYNRVENHNFYFTNFSNMKNRISTYFFLIVEIILLFGCSGGVVPSGNDLNINCSKGNKDGIICTWNTLETVDLYRSFDGSAYNKVITLFGENEYKDIDIGTDIPVWYKLRKHGIWSNVAIGWTMSIKNEESRYSFIEQKISTDDELSGKYNSFTDLAYFNGKFYCCFRSSTNHMVPLIGEQGGGDRSSRV